MTTKELIVDYLRPNTEEEIRGRINGCKEFAKALLWLDAVLKKDVVVHIADYMKQFYVKRFRASQMLEDFVCLGLLKKEEISGNFVGFIATTNSKDTLLSRYVSDAKGVLNL